MIEYGIAIVHNIYSFKIHSLKELENDRIIEWQHSLIIKIRG